MTTTNPYVGPRSFETNETLYGRDRERRQLTDRLIAERIVLLHSPSGAGKTSLVQAGLVPQLRSEGFFVHPVIRVNLERSPDLLNKTATLTDVNRFNRYTFSTLLSLEERYPPEERLDLPRLARLSFEDYLNFRSKEDGRDGPEFLIFDQFEEVLTIDPTDRAAKNAFFTQLGAALKNRDRWVLFAMRTDYVGALEPYVRMVPTYFANTFHLELLGVKAALEAIQKPAQEAGVKFTDGAATKLVDDLRRVQVQLLDGSMETQLGPHIEPVQLQVVCYRLWESKAADDQDIDESDLASVGDVNQSLAEYYAQSIVKAAAETAVTERSIREWFDRKLITPEGLRSQVRMGAEVSDGLPNATVRKLEDAHLIRGEKRAGQTWFELSHDRLVEPLRADNKKWFDANLGLFQRQSVLWTEQGLSEGLLLRGKELEDAEVEAKALKLTSEETAFLEACRALKAREQRDRRQRQLILVGLLASLAFLVLAVMGYFDATAQRRNAQLAANSAQTAQADAENARSMVQAASTAVIAQQSTSQAAILSEVSQKATAQYNSLQALADQATAQAVAATAQSDAQAQGQNAQASELVSQSLLSSSRGQADVAALLALEAFRIIDIPATRGQLLSFVSARNRLLLTTTTTSSSGTTPYLAFGIDNTTLASSNFYNCPEGNIYLCDQGVIRLWKIKVTPKTSGGSSFEISQDGDALDSVGILDAIALSPNGEVIASAFCDPVNTNIQRCEKEDIILWNSQTREQLAGGFVAATNIANDQDVRLAYSPDGNLLAIGVNDSTIIVWDLRSSTKKGEFAAGNGTDQMAFSLNNQTLAFARDRNIVLAAVDSLQTPQELTDASARPISSLVFSPDGQYLAAGSNDGMITLWDTETYEKVGQSFSYVSKVTSMAFSPDGKILAAGYLDYNIILWDMETRQRLARPLFKHTDRINSLAFSRDGKILVSASQEIVLWDTDPASWIQSACEIAGRNLTQREWQQYLAGQQYRSTCPQWPEGE